MWISHWYIYAVLNFNIYCMYPKYSDRPGRKVIKLFSCSTQLSMKISLLTNMKMPTMQLLLAFSYLLAEKFSCSAICSKKEFAIVRNLKFISRANFMLNWVEHEKGFITLGPEQTIQIKSDAAVCSIWSGSTLFAIHSADFRPLMMDLFKF